MVAEEGAASEGDPGSRLVAVPTYRRGDDYVKDILRGVTFAKADVCHVQYAPDLFGEDRRLPSLLSELEAGGVTTVVTLHTVFGPRRFRRLLGKSSTQSFHRALARHANRFIVHHEDGSADKLVAQGIPRQQIAVIPHGTPTPTLPDRAGARRRMNLPEDAFVFTFFGFIHRYKNVHTLIEAFSSVARAHPEARLVVAGMPWGDRWYNHLYVGMLKARILSLGLRDRVEVRDRYLPAEAVPDLYAATDVVLLPHKQSYGSASGVFHQAIGMGRPVICAVGPKFADASRLLPREFSVPSGDIRAWSRVMISVIDEPSLLTEGREGVSRYVEASAWPVVAAAHHDLYEDARITSKRG